ncbi:MAG: hypothetical protein PVG78_06525 [Desulfobacterales bacterium]|jgi:hypothetical protein
MKPIRRCQLAFMAVFFCTLAFDLFPAGAAFLYKSYIVKLDRGREILCDPYTVQKDDYVLKLLRQKGEIAAEDFPEFLKVFRRINPHIRDVNLIRPGQQISIPLRVLRSNEMPGQASGVVTIPYVTIKSRQDRIEPYAKHYRVQQGDCVSVLIAGRFGRYGSKAYWEGVRLFQMMNPTVTDLDRIYAGRILRLPEPSIQSAPWYAEVLGKKIAAPKPSSTPAAAGFHAGGPGDQAANPPGPLAIAAEALGAALLDRGTYFFPRPGGGDFRLDLSRVPAMEFSDGRLALLPEIDSPALAELETFVPFPARTDTVPISRNWKAERIVEAVLEKTRRTRPMDRLLVSAGGVRMEIHARWITGRAIDNTGEVGRVCILPIRDCDARTPEPVIRYLEEQGVFVREICEQPNQVIRHPVAARRWTAVYVASADRRSFVREVLTALGCQYTPNVSISFPYAGVQVQTQTNLVTLSDGREFLIDFGELYGNAISAIERTGFSVVQILQIDRRQILITLIEALGWPFQKNPTLWAAQREGPYNVAVTFLGFLVEDENNRRVLVSEAPLHHRMLDFLSDRGVRVVQVGFSDGSSPS